MKALPVWLLSTAVLAAVIPLEATAAPPLRGEFRYAAGRTTLGRFERVDDTTYRQTDDNARGFHFHKVVKEHGLFIELESKTVPGLKNRIYSLEVKRWNAGTDEWDHKFDGKWVK